MIHPAHALCSRWEDSTLVAVADEPGEWLLHLNASGCTGRCVPPFPFWVRSQCDDTLSPRDGALLVWCGGPDTWIEPMWGGDDTPCTRRKRRGMFGEGTTVIRARI